MPDGPDWYFSPGEALLQKPDLHAVLAQQVKWVEDGVKAAKSNRAQLAGHSNWITYWQERLFNWVGRHKILSFAYVVISAIVVLVLTILSAVGWIL